MAPGRVSLLALALILACMAACARGAFLEDKLPLKAVATTPLELLSGGSQPVMLSGRQTITAVFARPVIALGSDFGSAPNLVPFHLRGCNVPGLMRWVTTSIARFDPLVDWPTDLACTFAWNTDLNSYDGAPVVLPAVKTVRLVTPPLKMTLRTVESESANNLTDNQWNTFMVMDYAYPPDHPPEVPPDGNITLSFSYPVVLSQLQAALQVLPCCNSNAGSGKKVTVLPCYTPSYYLPLLPGQGSTSQTEEANTTCAVVRISPPLPQGEGAILRLPAGARYNPFAGSTNNNTDIYVWGLRSFRIPLRQNFQQLKNAQDTIGDTSNVIQYRRMTMWLPHGLALGTSLSALQRTMSICQYADPYNWYSYCKSINFNLTQPNKGSLLMTVPDLQPRQHYKLEVHSNSQIRDGYGLPLQNSTAFFFSAEPYPALQGPQLSSSDNVMLLEVPAGRPAALQWPLVAQGKEDGIVRAAAWKLRSGQLPLVLGGLASSRVQPDALGQPVDTFWRPNSTTASFGSLSLGSGPGMSLVGACCTDSTDSNDRPIKLLSNAMLVTQSNLQLAYVMNERQLVAWVITTQGSSSPVKGALVTAYSSTYGQAPTKGPSCTTGSDGVCVMALAALRTAESSSPAINVVAEAAGQGLVVSPNAYLPSLSQPSNYTGAVVLDRALVKPGDSLHVIGYIQARTRNGLALPSLTEVTLKVTPGFGSSSDFTMPVKVDPKYGSVHAVVPVPVTASGEFQVQLLAPATGEDSSSDYDTTSSGDDRYSMDYDTTSSGGVEIPGTSERFTVSDPRPPTAVLNITSPSWVMPNDTVRIQLRTISYIGAIIGNATITLGWRTPKANGELNVTTNATGFAEALIPLGKLPPANATKAGDTLTVNTQWVGPTREVISEQRDITIAEGPVSVELIRLPIADLPGVPFGIAATTKSNELDTFAQPVLGVAVTVSISPSKDGTVAGCSREQLESLSKQRCSTRSGANNIGACQLALPCMGDFVLRGCATAFANGTKIRGPSGNGACSESPIGRNATAWRASPWPAQPQLVLLPDKINYTQGETAVLALQNPWWGPASGMLVWGTQEQQKRAMVPNIPHGPTTLKVGPLGPECLGGCRVTLVVAVARPSGSPAAPLPNVPTSKLFDPLAPHTQSASVSLGAVQENILNVTVAVPGAAQTEDGEAVLAPDGSADITVRVVDGISGTPVAGAEVTVVVVDKAILDLMDYPVPDVASKVVPYKDNDVTIVDLNDLRVQRAAINATFDTLRRRLLSLDPLLPIQTTVQPGTGYLPAQWQATSNYPTTSPVDQPDELYLLQYTSPVTLSPFYSWGVSQRYPAASAVVESSSVLRLQGEFKTTPLFKVYTTAADGTATATFTAPANLGTFSVRAYITKNPGTRQNPTPSKYGANETLLVVRRPLSLTPSVPRAVRVGDDFEAGVIVSIPAGVSNRSTTVTVTAALISNGTSNSSTVLVLHGGSGDSGPSKTVTLSPSDEQEEVRFSFSAAAIGNATVRFVATTDDAAAAADALQLLIPVIGKQSDVFLATSFALAARNGTAARRVEGLVLPKAEPGSGSLDLLAGVGHVAALQASYEQLAEQLLPDDYAHGDSSLALGIMPAILAAYGPHVNTSSAPGDLTKANLRNISLTALNNTATVLTDSTYGLIWTAPAAGSFYSPSWTDEPLNAWALWLVSQVAAPQNDLAYASAWESLLATTDAWRTALEAQLVKDAEAARSATIKPQAYWNLDTLTWAHLALGPTWVPADATSQVKQDLSMARLIGAMVNLTMGGQARVGLALLQLPRRTSVQARALENIARGFQSNIRIAGRTAYIAAAPGSSSSASVQDQAFALLLLLRTNNSSPLLPAIANGLAAGQLNPVGALCMSTSAWDAPILALALQSYDKAQGSTKPDARLTVEAGPKQLLTARFTPLNPGYLAASSTPWAAVPAGAALSATAVGRGEVSVAASLHFTPADVLPFPTYRGLWVERVVQLSEDSAGAGSYSAVPLAKIVTVTVQVTSPDDLSQVVVDVLMPGGLEPLDPLVYPDTELQTLCGYRDTSSRISPWPMCPSQQTWPSVVRFTYTNLWAGTQVIRFKATAATVGQFLLPPVKAYAAGQPEVMGLSAAGNLTICDTGASAAGGAAAGGAAATCAGGGSAKATAPAKGCPSDCSGNGVCNLAAGTCMCNAGFKGAACDAVAGSR